MLSLGITGLLLFLLGPTLGPTELILILVLLVILLIPFGIVRALRKRSEGKKKSQLIGVILILLFGPIGLAYTKRSWDLAVLVAAVVWAPLVILETMVGVAISIACYVFGFLLIRDHNRKLALEAEKTTLKEIESEQVDGEAV